MPDPADTLNTGNGPCCTEHGTPDPSTRPLSENELLYSTLTARERQVAISLSYGLTNREIASSVNISIKTVDTHRGHVLKKLKLKNNVALARFMLREGLVNP